VSIEELTNAAMTIVAGETGDVAVLGEGRLAGALRERLGSRVAAAPTGASVVIDTTGEAEQIAAALSAVEDLGVILLAGSPPAAPLALDLYSDLHVRGLRVIGLRQAAEVRQ
jgi:D-arabinose 1-dehydrogenase-like Zn-dependent alcohol dehydrogenase